MGKEPTDTFEGEIQALTTFVNRVLRLSQSYSIIFYDYLRGHCIDEYRIQQYLNNPKNIQILQHYVRILKRFTNKKIKEAIPDGIIDENNVLFLPNYEEKIRNVIKEEINSVIIHITGILDRNKILSVNTKHFNYNGKPQKMLSFETELINSNLIERTKYFLEIFQGKAPNEKINWVGSASGFRFFINELFDTKLFNHLTKKWIIAENSFTINGNTIPENIRTYKDRDVNVNIVKTIKSAISYLID